MHNQTKVLIIILSAIILATTGDHFLRHYLIIPEFIALEEQEADKKMGAISDALQRESFHLGNQACDWAVWDSMYEYVASPSTDFATSNFRHESLAASGIDLVYVCDNSEKIIWGSAMDPQQNQMLSLPEFEQDKLRQHRALFDFSSADYVFGLMNTSKGVMLVGSHQILTSAKKGPVRGTVILGRFITSSILEKIAEQTRAKFTAREIPTLTAVESARWLAFQKDKFIYDRSDPKFLSGFHGLNDLEKLPVLLIEAKFPRDILRKGEAVARLVSLSMFAALAAICGFLIIWIKMFKTKSLQRQKEIEDLVEQRTAELQESRERLLTLINATPDIISLKDDEGRWQIANQANLELFRLSQVNYQGKTDQELAELTHPIYKEAFLSTQASDNRAWERGCICRCIETIPTPAGSARIFDVIKIPVFQNDGQKKNLIVFGRDVTSERILHDKLQKAEKMEAIGMMAGGVAHDLNNILSGIIGYPELLLMIIKDDPKARRMIEGIRESGKRASEIVADLLTVARGVVATREVKNLNSLIAEYLESPEFIKLKSLHGEVEFKSELDPDLINISCSPVHIRKCLMNLSANAAEAMHQGGKITISTRNVYLDQVLPEFHNLPIGEYAVLRVSDTGSGISANDITRIFEPFYTKKVLGRSGTGLGLSVVWNSVQNHGGSVFVTSDSRGSTFELYFPASRGAISESPADVKIDSLQGKGETILVIDDEPHQREIATCMLTSLGYQVNSVASGEEALNYIRERPADLLVLDMIMDPGMRGRETYEKILQIRPGQKAIIASGFSNDLEVKKTQEMGAGAFVKKPYLLSQIGQAVQQALQNPPK